MTAPLIDDLTFDTDTLIEWASSEVRSYCGWHIAPSLSETITRDSDGGKVLFLPTMYLTDITELTIDGDEVDDIDAAVSWSEFGLVRRTSGQCWPDAYRSVTLKITHGYQDTPGEIAKVCVALAKRGPAAFNFAKSETAGAVSRTYGADLLGGFAASGFTLEEERILDRYRVRNRP